MYSAQTFQLNKDEFNYLLPVLKNKLNERGDRYYIVSDNISDLTDILNRLKGLYNPCFELNDMLVYKCCKDGSLMPFRNTFGINNLNK